jgi:hypothetical protein
VNQQPNYLDYGSAGRRALPSAVTTLIKFMLSLMACTVACTVLWQCFVTDVLYHCTDSLGLDYLQGPSDWVHGAAAGQPGDFGDTIHPGWTLGRLTALWYLLIVGSIIVSVIASRIGSSRASKQRQASYGVTSPPQ